MVHNHAMSPEYEITSKEQKVKDLSDPRWYWLISQRREFVEQEKINAAGKPFEQEVKQSIDRGYINLLDCVLKISK
jgi:hypothetical protein